MDNRVSRSNFRKHIKTSMEQLVARIRHTTLFLEFELIVSRCPSCGRTVTQVYHPENALTVDWIHVGGDSVYYQTHECGATFAAAGHDAPR